MLELATIMQTCAATVVHSWLLLLPSNLNSKGGGVAEFATAISNLRGGAACYTMFIIVVLSGGGPTQTGTLKLIKQLVKLLTIFGVKIQQ